MHTSDINVTGPRSPRVRHPWPVFRWRSGLVPRDGTRFAQAQIRFRAIIFQTGLWSEKSTDCMEPLEELKSSLLDVVQAQLAAFDRTLKEQLDLRE